MKDNFSIQSSQYAMYRPHYPKELFSYLSGLLKTHQVAWDCGTGNGQVAYDLTPYFEQVFATDLSQAQLTQAIQHPKIIYKAGQAENALFQDQIFDLITVAQAIHWFDFEAFYKQVVRTLKPTGFLAVIGYDLIHIDKKTDAVISKLYKEILGPFWDKERAYIDQQYQTIPFPFAEVTPPAFTITYEWTLEHLVGYLGTWSAAQHYLKKKHQNPIEQILPELKEAWGQEKTRTVTFPILLRIGSLLSEKNRIKR